MKEGGVSGIESRESPRNRAGVPLPGSLLAHSLARSRRLPPDRPRDKRLATPGALTTHGG